MKWSSTRNQSPALTFNEALHKGLAPDGGLYVPEAFPQIDQKLWERWNPTTTSVADVAPSVLSTLLSEEDFSISTLTTLCKSSFNFPIRLKRLASNTKVLELFHGPTCAFKDVGARFLAETLDHLKNHSGPYKKSSIDTILVATSGDTGGAVAGAFSGRRGFEVILMYPKGRISTRQEKQLTCWQNNVLAFAVEGTFDDCQKMAKLALNDSWWSEEKKVRTANSINVGRLIPQMTYYAWAAVMHYRDTGRAPSFIIPSGNLGNAVAALWAKRVGFPMNRMVMATNANHVVKDFIETGKLTEVPTVSTLANAMDVSRPSNLERLRHLCPSIDHLKSEVSCFSVDDEKIRQTIRCGESRWGEIMCPHTATAFWVREQLTDDDWIVVATAHPAKFDAIVEPLVGHSVETPSGLQVLLDRPSRSIPMKPDLDKLRSFIANRTSATHE